MKVSVLTCTYDRPALLVDCVLSVRRQATPHEHIVTDDGSTSTGQRDVLAIISRDDPRVIVQPRPHVDQPARYWNEMIDRARGEYVCILDDDCRHRPDFMARMVGHLDAHPDVDVATCGYARHEGDVALDVHLNLETPSLIDRRNTVDTSTFLIRRKSLERVGYFPLDIRTNEDWAMARRMHHSLRVDHLPDVLVDYTAHPAQRAHRREHLGNVRDKERVRWEKWSSYAAVGIVDATSIRRPRKEGENTLRNALADILWAIETISGDNDITVVNEPAARPEVALAVKRAAKVVAVCLTEPIFNVNAVEALRREKETWVVTPSTKDWPLYRDIVGEHVIACPLDDKAGYTAERLGRILNAARSPRYEALIP